MRVLFVYIPVVLLGLFPAGRPLFAYSNNEYAVAAGNWGRSGCDAGDGCQGADLDGSGEVDSGDLRLMAGGWLFADEVSGFDSAMAFADAQLRATAAQTPTDEYPYSTINNYTQWWNRDSRTWTSGFFPGCLWKMHAAAGDPNYLTWATDWTANLEGEAGTNYTQDLGFMIFNTFYPWYERTGEANLKTTILQAADTAASLYSPVVGLIDANWGPWEYPVNIDSMMAMELLFWAAKNGGDASYYDLAVDHANHIEQYYVRADGSTHHFANYDSQTGELIEYLPGGGYDETTSTWSRGHAWGIYGFTVCYRETGDPNFLRIAHRLADYYIRNLPADFVPYWDFDAPGIPDTSRDSSAASIAAAALFELAELTPEPIRRKTYYIAAVRTLDSLCTPFDQGGYLAVDAEGNLLSKGILMEGCQNINNICDESMIWGDYYLLEAMERYAEMK